METEKLRQKILTLDKKRQTHQIDNSEYIDTVIQFIAQYTNQARIDEAQNIYNQLKLVMTEQDFINEKRKLSNRLAELSKEGEKIDE